MNCFLCDSASEFYTTHNYFNGPFCEVAIDADLHETEFHRCKNCGSVFSKTHRELPVEKLAQLMAKGHFAWEKIKSSVYENRIALPFGTAPHLQEAVFLNLLGKNELIDTGNMLDYAAGSGHLSKVLQKYFGLPVINYEPFAKDARQNYITKNELQKYSLVLNCAMFQCLTKITPFVELCDLIAPEGALFLQTMVKEEITPDYFAHMVFSPMCITVPTNKGMQILMERFGFVSSIYSPKAKSWVLFKNEPKELEEKIRKINLELFSHEIYYKKGFVDFWK